MKISQIAKELVVRYKAESKSKNKLLIYGFNSNISYSLVYGKNIGRVMGFNLITDGEIESIDYPDRVGKEYLFYESPLNPNEGIQLKLPKVADVKILKMQLIQIGKRYVKEKFVIVKLILNY